MHPSLRRLAIGAIIALLLLGVIFAAYLAYVAKNTPPLVVTPTPMSGPEHKVIGTSVEGRTIDAYTYSGAGSGDKKHLVFVGGIHGGYEWNSSLLAYQFMDHLDQNPKAVPDNLKITVIPSANPDGLFKIVGKEGRFTALDVSKEKEAEVLGNGRFNANAVDLNRNFDCKWKPESMWRSKAVSAGTQAFSEPEARAIRDFALGQKPDAFVFWHSQASAVYASECTDGILPETLTIMDAYANASGYKAVQTFDAYEVTGDAEGWLASIGIPAITVELSTHETVEWDKNIAGVKALIEHYRLAK
jgi:predicted deacylase